MRDLRYQPYYCEENVWWLLQSPALGSGARWALFISNPARQCAFWQQRAAPPGQLLVWDYHVVALVADAGGAQVWDLDSRLGMPLPLPDYLAGTFRPPGQAHPQLAPRFRPVPARALLERFSTDRSHMRAPGGGWLQPPPDWPAPCAAGVQMNLPRYIDMTDAGMGQVLDLPGLAAQRWAQ